MSSRTAFALAWLAISALVAPPLRAQDWESFAASSSRSMDPEILGIMAGSDLEQNIALCKGLGSRADADVRVFLDSLAAAHASKRALGMEVLLRWLLSSVLDASLQEQSLRAWREANASSVDMLLTKIAEWADPQLKGSLLKLAVIANNPAGIHAIVEVGTGVVHELKRSDGLIPSQDAALALDFLSAAQRAARSDFFPYCVDIARLSRDAALVRAARAAATALAGAP